jgi:CHAT domain-containing protein/tetratricopeptide (TPR) repeat protein
MKVLALMLALLAAAACGQPAHELDTAIEAAQAALRRGAIDVALAELDRVQPRAERDRNSLDLHQLRLLRAEVLLAKPNVDEASRLLDTPLPDQPEFTSLGARERYLRARVQLARGQLKEALATLDTIPRSVASDVRLDADVLAGQILLRLGRWSEGENRLEAVVAEAADRGDRYRQVLALNNLGMGLVVRSRLDEAASWFERVLSFTDLEDTSVYAIAMNNVGACYARLGHFDRALEIQRRAVALHERRGAAAPYEQALGELGSTYLLLEDVPRAVPFLTKALEVATQAALKADAAVWARNLTAAYVQTGDWDKAERFNAEARQLTPPESARKLLFNTIHSAKIAAGRGRHDEAARLFTSLLGEAAAEPSVRWAAHEGLALLAKYFHDSDRATFHLNAALEIIERTRSDLLKTDDRLSFVTGLMRFYREYVDLLVDQRQPERALLIADSSRGRVLAERHGIAPPPAVNAAAVRELAARSKGVFVAYWLTPKQSYVWIVDPHGIRIQSLPPAAEIETLVRAHQAAIHNVLADPQARGGAGDRLYQLLVTPILPSLRTGSPVVIIADGALHGLNFETLPVDGPRPHYWIEDVEIQTAPSLALLVAKLPAIAARSLLVIGNPTPHDPEFPALRHASTEIDKIIRHFGPDRSRSYEREAASAATYRSARPEQFAFVHFTAHATANLDSPLDSAVILSGPDQAFKFYARDVAEVPLRAELVTVSACRSAGERAYSGEGLVGFAWAFLRAGARRVIAGLWDVDDQSTAELMDALYARLAAGDPPSRALRQAKLSLLSRNGTIAKPYYWGPFQLFTTTPM